MIGALLGGLTWRIGAFILAGTLGATLIAGGIDRIRLRAEIATLTDVLDKTSKQAALTTQSLGTCQANYRAIELALDRQGADIRGLAEATKAAGDRAAAAALRGAADAKAAREASQRVLALPRPAPDMACEAAARLLRGPM
jgi:hypothetical protein